MNMRIKRMLALIIAVILVIGLPSTVLAANTETIRVGYYISDGCMNGGEGEVKSGYAYEYLCRIAGYTGWTYDYVYGDFSNLYSMLLRGEIDLLPDITYTEERAQDMLFPDVYEGIVEYYVITDSDNWDIQKPEDIAGHSVGVLKDSYDDQVLTGYCHEKNLNCTIIRYNDIESLFNALKKGSIPVLVAPMDAVVSAGYRTSKQVGTIGDSKPYYIAVNKNRPDICSQINTAMTMIQDSNPNYFQNVYNRYISDDLFYSAQELSAKEINWLEENPHINVGYLADYLPFTDTNPDTGEFDGIFRDIMDDMVDRFGITYNAKEYKSYDDLLNAVHSGEIDALVPSSGNLWCAEANQIALSDTFATTTIRAIFKNTFDENNIKTIAVCDQYKFQHQYVEEQYPNADVISYDDSKSCISAITNGEADVCFYLESCYKRDSTKHPEWFDGLNTARIDDHTVSMCFATDLGRPHLLNILNYEAAAIDKHLVLNSSIEHSQYVPEMSLRAFIRENAVMATSILAAFVILVISFFAMFVYTSNKNRRMLEKAEAEAIHANQAKSQFLSQMSHDIRTPMNAIKGMTELMKPEVKKNPVALEYLDKISASANILLGLLNDILDSSAIESGKLRMSNEVFNFRKLIQSITDVYYLQCKKKGVDFKVLFEQIPEENLVGDSMRLNQILMNLISNAYKFTSEGGRIAVTVSETDRDKDNVYLRFKVSDNGEGMSEDMLSRLFKPFEQENRETYRKHGGSGLGMSIVKNLVTLMHGAIEVESEKGVGTTFTVDLPFGIDKDKTPLIIRDNFRCRRALIVDDNQDTCRYAAAILNRMGIEYETAFDGESAISLLQKSHDEKNGYDICFIDWKMGSLSGVDVARKVRELYDNATVVIIITAYDKEAVKEAAKGVEIDRIISKPVFESTIYDLIMDLSQTTSVEQDEAADGFDFTGRHVLVADDDLFNREVAKGLLELVNIDAECVPDGQDAVKRFAESAPGTYDAILLDVHMEFMGGYEACKCIRASAHPEAHSIPVYALTADAFPEDIAKAHNSGMDGHLSKPIDPDILYSTLEKAFNNQK